MLFLHNRSVRGDGYSPALSEAIRSSFFSDDRSSDGLRVARVALTDLHRHRLWLACDCQGTAAAMPMIGPRDGRGGMHPFRFGEVRHAEGCPFAGDIRTPSTVDEADDLSGPVLGSWHLDALVRDELGVADRAAALNRLLRTALHQLGYDRLHVSSFNLQAPRGTVLLLETPFVRLRQLGSQDVGRGQTFSQVGCTFLPGIHRTFASLRKLAEESKSAAPPVGLFIGVVEDAVPTDATHAGVLTAKDQQGVRRSIPVSGPIHIPLHDSGTKGPYWAVGLITQHSKSRDFRLSEAALIHALDRRTLFPIPDAEYRPIGKVLLEQVVFWRQWKKLQIEVELRVDLFSSDNHGMNDIELILANGSRLKVQVVPDGLPHEPSDGLVTIEARKPLDAGIRKLLTAAVASLHEGGNFMRNSVAPALQLKPGSNQTAHQGAS